MNTLFWVSYVALWVMSGVLLLLVLLLYRQFGMSFMDANRRMSMEGLDLGATAPDVELLDAVSQQPLEWTWEDRIGRATLAVFALPVCSICKALRPELAELVAQRQDVRFVWVDGIGSGPEAGSRAVDLVLDDGIVTAVSPEDRAHALMEVGGVPFVYVIGADGRVQDKGLINTSQDIERLLERTLGSTQPVGGTA